LNVVIVASELPYPPTAGNRIRTLNLALRLVKRHRLTFIAHRNSETEAARSFLEDHGIGTVLVDRNIPTKVGPWFYARLLANLGSSLPYSAASHGSDELRDAVRSFRDRDDVDLWQVESIFVFDTLRCVTNAPKVAIAHNVESVIWRRYFEVESNPLKRWYIKQQWRKIERFEGRVFAESTGVVAVSDEDARLTRESFGARRVDVVANGIDRNYFEAVQRDPEPATILFLGGFDWRPNLDAVKLLLDRIFPAVRAAEPAARLRLVGRRPSPALVRRIAEVPGVELHADVPDVRPFLANSGVMVVPLRIGGGSRLKILEAMAAGLPVISTRVGAEGLELVPDEHYVAAEEPEDLAEALVAFIRNPWPARAIAERSRTFVLNRYDWDSLADRLERVWFACLENGNVTRAMR